MRLLELSTSHRSVPLVVRSWTWLSFLPFRSRGVHRPRYVPLPLYTITSPPRSATQYLLAVAFVAIPRESGFMLALSYRLMKLPAASYRKVPWSDWSTVRNFCGPAAWTLTVNEAWPLPLSSSVTVTVTVFWPTVVYVCVLVTVPVDGTPADPGVAG